jgi:hypothetical protein
LQARAHAAPHSIAAPPTRCPGPGSEGGRSPHGQDGNTGGGPARACPGMANCRRRAPV